ncbi:hypothetical protein OL229_09100 [Neisseriaceae bacterium JH1-16]|nr:hypothetical protein [Neisseriaceae bacterium JH1-16]
MRHFLPLMLAASLVVGCGKTAELTTEDIGKLYQAKESKKALSASELRSIAEIQQHGAEYLANFIDTKVKEEDYDFFFRAVPAGALEKYPLINRVMSAPSVMADQGLSFGNKDAARYEACEQLLSDSNGLYWAIRETQPVGVLKLDGNGTVNMQRQKISQASKACSAALGGK